MRSGRPGRAHPCAEAFGGNQGAPSTEIELDRIAISIDAAVQQQLFTFDLHIGLV